MGEFIFTLICIFVPGMQPFLPIAVATDAAWMSEYASQVTNNYLKSKNTSENFQIIKHQIIP